MSTRTAVLDMHTVSRAAVSSLVATLVDGAVYQLLLFALPSHYGLVALCGAVAGGVTNFTINRSWTFHASHEHGQLQAVRYAFTSLGTFLSLRAMLWLLVDLAGVSARIAWLPAKLLAFLFVSYPAQRAWVFATRSAFPSGAQPPPR
jgi:putative flippase GtrA